MELNPAPTEAERAEPSIFTGVSDLERHQYETGVKKARNALFAAGGIMFVVDILMALIGYDSMSTTAFWTIVGFDLVILAVFIGLGLWTKKKPFTAIVAGLVIFCAIQLLAMIGDPTNIYKGIIVKVVVVVTLISGIKNAKKLQDLNRLGL